PGNFTANSESYRSIPQIIAGEKAGTSLVHNQELLKKVFYEESSFNLMSRVFDPELYTKYYKIYKRAAEEINVDLFFCDFGMNFACFDLAWQLKKPVVGFAASPMFAAIPPPYKSDPIFGCHVTMEYESFYDRFKCAVVKPFQFIWSFMSMGSNLNNQRVSLGVEPYWNPRSRTDNILFLFDTFLGFE
ncbi:1443_t:CDS:2, partial [Gigaspora margarita]